MASPNDQLKAFVQSVYLVIKGRYFDDIDGEDGITLMQSTADWTNMFIEELETELDSNGDPVDWKFARTLGFTLGTAVEGAASIAVPSGINYLLTDENRYVQVLQDGLVISNWAVVSPDQISNKSNRITEDMCTLTGTVITFSRPFRDTENNGTIIGDVTTPIPPMVVSADGKAVNIKVLNLVKPGLLLKLGVAKNASLPDIVQGGLSPSYAQKYADLLTNAIARNGAGAVGSTVQTDDFSGIAGVY